MFQVEIKHKEQLFEGFTRSERDYTELQKTIMNMSARLRFSRYDNEATRGSLLVAKFYGKLPKSTSWAFSLNRKSPFLRAFCWNCPIH